MTPLEEAEALVVALSKALDEVKGERPYVCEEDKVAYRFDTMIGVLTLARADAIRLYHSWEGK